MIFQSEIESLLAEISSYESLIAAKRQDVERFQVAESKISQGLAYLQEAMAIAGDKALSAIQSQLSPYFPTAIDSGELERLTSDRDNLLVRIANESEAHYKELVEVINEKSKLVEQYEQTIHELNRENILLQQHCDRLCNERHYQEAEIQSLQRRLTNAKADSAQPPVADPEPNQVEEKWVQLSARVWHCAVTKSTVVAFQKKNLAKAWGDKLNLFLGTNAQIAPITGAPNGFKYELKAVLGDKDAAYLASQNLDADPQQQAMKNFPGNIYHQEGSRDGIIANLVNPDERERSDRREQQSHQAAA